MKVSQRGRGQLRVVARPRTDGGAIFICEKGKLEINRNKFSSNPHEIAAELLKQVNVAEEDANGVMNWHCGRRGGTCRTGSTVSVPAIGPWPMWKSATARSRSVIWPTSLAISDGRSAGMRSAKKFLKAIPTPIVISIDRADTDSSCPRRELARRLVITHRRRSDGETPAPAGWPNRTGNFRPHAGHSPWAIGLDGHAAAVEEHLHENWVIAHNVATGRGYLLTGASPTAHKPPVYPLFLVLMIRLFGEQPFLAIRIVQSFIFAAAAGVAFVVFRFLVSGRLALLATVLMVISPFLRKVHLWIDSVSMSLAGILIVLLLTILTQRDASRTGRFVLLGIASGLLALTLPATLGFVPVIGLWLAFHLPRQARIGRVSLYVAGVLLALVPWTVRNAIVFGRLMPVSSNLKLEFWIGSNPDATGGMQNERREPVTEPRGALAERLAGLSEVQRNDALGDEASGTCGIIPAAT